MSTQTETGIIPAFDIGDRMRKSLQVSRTAVQEMADFLEVDRGSVGRWINGKVSPSAATVRLWAIRTGVSYEWLRNGETPAADSDGGPTVRPEGFEPPTFWFGAGHPLTSTDAWELAA